MRTHTAVLAAATLTASAIVTRHDTADRAYLELARSIPEAASIDVNMHAPKGAPNGHATLIAARWLLTAAHVADRIEPGHTIPIAGADYTVARTALHPQFKPRNPIHDAALIELTEPVVGLEPLPLFEGDLAVGDVIEFAGYGDHGTGDRGPTGFDGERRAARNRIAELNDLHLVLAFDEPGTPDCLEFEGVPGPGDSGNGGLIQTEGRFYLAGVSSGQDPNGAGGPGRYGALDYFVRVDAIRDWIDTTLEE